MPTRKPFDIETFLEGGGTKTDATSAISTLRSDLGISSSSGGGTGTGGSGNLFNQNVAAPTSSIENDLLQSEDKNTGQVGFQPKETEATLERE